MKTYCGKGRKKNENLNSKIFKTKKVKILKKQGAKELLSSLGLKTWLSKIRLFGDIFFWVYKMNEIVNKFLLVDDKFMPEIQLKQAGCTYSASGPFTKNKEGREKIMQTGNTDFICRNELDKACFQNDMAYGKSKDLTKRTQSDKVLRDKAFKIASYSKYVDYQRGLASMVSKFFDKNSSERGVATGPNYQLSNELHRQIIWKFKRWKVSLSFTNNIWSVDLGDM